MLAVLLMERIILYYVTISLIYSTVSSHPMNSNHHTASSGSNRKSYETYNRREEPNSTINNIKFKSMKNPEAVVRDGNGRKYEPYTKNGIKRGLDIGVHLKLPRTTQKYSESLSRLEDILEKALGGRLKEVLNSSSCPSCDEEEPAPVKRIVKPAFECDDWDAKLRLCVLERNIGDTVTFYISTGDFKGHKPNVTWKKEFHMQNTETRTGFVLDPENSPQNIIIGKQGYELRISPVTEVDVGYNLFSATLNAVHVSKQSKVYFVVRIVPIDLGFVYVGETIELNLRSFVSLPLESVTFKWYIEKYGEHGTLPSNMRTSSSGSSIKISELRQEQEGILACSVYTNLDFLATKKRFLIKDLVKNNDVLESAPDHDIIFKEEYPYRRKRGPKKVARHKRYLNIDDLVDKALDSTTTEKHVTEVTSRERTLRPYSDYALESDIGKAEPITKTVETFENRYQDQDEYLSGHSRNQNIDEAKSPHLEATIEGELESKSSKQNTAHKELNHLEFSPEGQNRQGNGHEASDELKSTALKTNQESIKNYTDAEIKKESHGSHTGDSEIVLNIDKIPGPRHVSAEENIGKLISSCYTDFECAAAATCVRFNLKQKGFCKCLPGYYGVGIFCREDIWLSKRNFDLEEIRNLEDIPYSSYPPAFHENI